MDSELTKTGENWHERIGELQALLDELRPQLIDAEAQLAELLAAISAFEYKVHARLGNLSNRLDDLQAEIDELRRQIRRQIDLIYNLPAELEGTEDSESWHFQESAATSGAFRYRKTAETPHPAPEGNRLAALKQLYRSLARRFHPDLALNDADRAYRTDLMMAINAAYAAGDLERLEALAGEPDSITHEPDTPEELATALQHEVDRCRRRLEEIAAELAMLENHHSTRLMRRAERAAAVGRDLLEEMAADLRSRVAEKLVERDALEYQLEEVEREGWELSAENLADIVFNLGLEQADEGNLFGAESGWRPRNPRPWETNDGQDEDEPDDTY